MTAKRVLMAKRVSGDSREMDKVDCAIKAEAEGKWRVDEKVVDGNNKRRASEQKTGEMRLGELAALTVQPVQLFSVATLRVASGEGWRHRANPALRLR